MLCDSRFVASLPILFEVRELEVGVTWPLPAVRLREGREGGMSLFHCIFSNLATDQCAPDGITVLVPRDLSFMVHPPVEDQLEVVIRGNGLEREGGRREGGGEGGGREEGTREGGREG